jgi:predicted negative regulator of RcsB-dependent stress response
MMFRAFSLKNVLWGILLGLMFVCAWVYFSEVMDRFRSSAPEMKQKVTALIHDQEEKVKPYVEKISTTLAEKKEAFVSPLSKKEKGPDAAYDEKGTYPLLAFNSRKTAEDFMASIKRSTGVDLWLR